MSSNYPLKLDPDQRARWEEAAERSGRTLAGWIKRTCDNEAQRLGVKSLSSKGEAMDFQESLQHVIRQVHAEKLQRREEETHFASSWPKKREEAIGPRLVEAARVLKESGILSSAYGRESVDGVELAAGPNQDPPLYSLLFSCDRKRQRIAVTSSFGDKEEFELAQITEETVAEKLQEFVRQVVSAHF